MPLRAGETAPFDRAYAIENGPGRFDPQNPAHLPKINFLMLMRNERLATLQTRFDDATETLTMLRDGKQVARGDLTTPIGRKMIEQFLAAYMQDELRGAPRDRLRARPQLLRRRGQMPAHRQPGLRARAGARRRPPGRTRCASAPTSSSTGRAVGRVRLDRHSRCSSAACGSRSSSAPSAARRPMSIRTTGKRDMAIPAALQRACGHTDFGVYARVIADGTIAVGDPVAA